MYFNFEPFMNVKQTKKTKQNNVESFVNNVGGQTRLS